MVHPHAVVGLAVASIGSSLALGQQSYTETVSVQTTLQVPGVSGSGQVAVPQFDTGDGRRILASAAVDGTVLSTSRVRGTVSHPPFSGGPQAESRGRLRVSGQVRLSTPASSQVTLPIDRGGTVFSTGISGSPPRPGFINLSSSNEAFPTRLPTLLTAYTGTSDWQASVSWTLSTSFEPQEGPNLWQFTDRRTDASVRITATYTYTIDPATVTVDINNDGEEDFFDVLAYLALFDAEDPAADITLDGSVTTDDLSEFLRAIP